jgi:flagellar protein FlgJ
MLSDNFSVAELARSGDKTFGVARIDPRQITCLQNIRNRVGRPVLIRSGYRSYWHNIEVYRRLGRRPTSSQHLSGRASDIKIEGMTGVEIAKAAIDACGPDIAVGLGPSFAHVDVRGDSGVWKYEGVTNQQVAEVERHRASRRVALRVRPRRQRRDSLP